MNDQFQYKISITPEQHVFIIQARFGVAFGLVLFGSTQLNVLEPVIDQLRTKYGNDGPFVVLQSPHQGSRAA